MTVARSIHIYMEIAQMVECIATELEVLLDYGNCASTIRLEQSIIISSSLKVIYINYSLSYSLGHAITHELS